MTSLQKLPKNVGKLLVTKGFKSCPKSNKYPNLVTLGGYQVSMYCIFSKAHSI